MAADPSKASDKAKAVLAKAQDFTKSVEGKSPGRFAPKPTMPKPATPVAPPPANNVRAQNIAVANQEAAKYGMHGVPIMHAGGKVKKDGPVILKKDETVRTPEQEKKMQDKLKKKSSKAEAVMTKDEKKPESEKKGGKKKKHVHKIEIEKKKGGYLVRTHSKAEPGAEPQAGEGPEESVHPDLASVTDHLNQNMGPDEEGAGAEPPPAAPAAPQQE